MINRVELKARGKSAFMKNFWAAVLVSFLIAFLGINQVTTVKGRFNTQEYTYDYSYVDGHGNTQHSTKTVGLGRYLWEEVTHGNFFSGIVTLVTSLFFLIFVALGVALRVLVLNIIEIGGRRFYIQNRYSNPSAGTVFQPFRDGYYWNQVKILFFRDLFVALWSLLFVIPGVVKAYEYRMVPYLLAEVPDMDRREAFGRSREMMQGHKMDAFILDLSFIGWLFLGGITCGVVNLFFTNPYMDAVSAELYESLKWSR